MDLKYKFYRFKYLHGRHLPLRTPVDVSLELSSYCNMKCNYCYHSDSANLPFQMGFMDQKVAKKIIDECSWSGVDSLKFNWKGEATMHPSFGAIAYYARKKGTFTELICNSNFKIPKSKRDDVFFGLSQLDKVKVSFDSFRPEVFEKQRAGGNHSLTFENICLFYEYLIRENKNTKLVIQAVRTNLNKNEDIEGMANKLWPDAEVSVRDMVVGRVDKNVDEYKLHDLTSNRQSCLQAHVRLIFNHEGKAFPCCPDIGEKLCLGDIRKQDIKEIFNSLEAKRLRKDLKTGKAFDNDPCKSCPSYESYKGYVPNKHA